MSADAPLMAVVGHVEWIEFIPVPRVPVAGEIVHGEQSFSAAAGGGAVAAVQLARLGAEVHFFTALGEDEAGRAARGALSDLGVIVHACTRPAPQRRGVTLLDSGGERTIVTIGERLDPRGSDDLPWGSIEHARAVYVTAGDTAALARARRAPVVVASPRARALVDTPVADVLLYSADDETEVAVAARLGGAIALRIATEGARGGEAIAIDGSRTRWLAASPPGPRADTYGSGDSFAGGLTYGLGLGLALPAALDLAARCGATCLTGRGPYDRQLTARER